MQLPLEEDVGQIHLQAKPSQIGKHGGLQVEPLEELVEEVPSQPSGRHLQSEGSNPAQLNGHLLKHPDEDVGQKHLHPVFKSHIT